MFNVTEKPRLSANQCLDEVRGFHSSHRLFDYSKKRLRAALALGMLNALFFSPSSAYAVNDLVGTTSSLQESNELITSNANPLDVRLYAQNENLVIRLSNGHHAVFKPDSTETGYRLFRKKTHYHELLGNIESQSSRRIWTIDSNTQVEFLGSYPIKYLSKGGASLSLTYQHGKLNSYASHDVVGEVLPIDKQETLSNLQTIMRNTEIFACPELFANEPGQSNPLLEELNLQQALADGESCQNPDAPPPLGFGETSDDMTLQIDVRPADCLSYFTAYPDIERGSAIEEAIGEHPPYLGSESGGQSFPIADFWNNGSVFVLISRDLTAASYDTNVNPDGLYDQLMQDGENIHNNLIMPLAEEGQITHTELGVTTTLTSDDAQVIYLDVVVQFGVMTPEQQAIFDQAAIDLLETYGIVLRIIEIP